MRKELFIATVGRDKLGDGLGGDGAQVPTQNSLKTSCVPSPLSWKNRSNNATMAQADIRLQAKLMGDKTFSEPPENDAQKAVDAVYDNGEQGVTWTKDEEKKLLRKIDLMIVSSERATEKSTGRENVEGSFGLQFAEF